MTLDSKKMKLLLVAAFFLIVSLGTIAGMEVYRGGKEIHADDGQVLSDKIKIVNTADFKDWRFECAEISNKEKSLSCRIFQRLALGEGVEKKFMLSTTAIIVNAKTEKEIIGIPILRFVTASGVLSSEGLIARIDKDKPIKVPFANCNKENCFAELPLNNKMVEILKNSKSFIVGFKLADARPVNLEVSLKGFSEGFDVLIGAAKERLRPNTEDTQ